MFDAINIGTTGLLSHAKGLRVVGNNLANVNTPGFKGSQLVFSDLFSQTGGGGTTRDGQSGSTGLGTGLATLGSQINFKAGLDTATGRPLDVNIDGNGFYAIEREGQILYTRAGDFNFDEKGVLVTSAGEHVKALDSAGKLSDITLANMERSLPKGTTNIEFRGVASSTSATVKPKVDGVIVYDKSGVNHPVNLLFALNTGSPAGTSDFTVTVTDTAGATLATGHVIYTGGVPVDANNSISFKYAPGGADPVDVKLDFSKTSSKAEPTTLAVATNDGYALGEKTDQNIDADGVVTVFYSNGQKATGQRLALANFNSAADLEQQAGSAFSPKHGVKAEYGYAGSDNFGKLQPGHREGSNVDLAEEFGNLILMQRGYQASSHVISTANDMIQQLFDMKGR